MDYRIKLFGPPARMAGASEVSVGVEGPTATIAELRAGLAAVVPALAPLLKGCRLAVNCAYAAEADQVQSTDEIALIGMVSGG